MNNQKKTIFLIALYFPPINKIGSERALKIARSFLAEGYDVTVFTLALDTVDQTFIDNHDRSLDVQEGSLKIVRVRVDFNTFFEMKKPLPKIRNFLSRVLVKITHEYIVGDLGFYWYNSLMKAVRTELIYTKPSMIIATGSPYYSFLVPLKLKKEFAIPYTLDFRDLWLDNPQVKPKFLAKMLVKRIEKEAVVSADFITTVSEGCKNKLFDRYQKNIIVLYNLPDNQYISYTSSLKENNLQFDKSFINIYYAGTLYRGERSFKPLLEAILQLDKKEQQIFKFHYYGRNEERAKKDFDEFDLSNLLITYGNVDKQQVLKAMWNSDVLLSLVHSDIVTNDLAIQGIITTKIFDYLITGKYIINIAPQNAEINTLISNTEYPRFFSFNSTQINEMSLLLKQIYDFHYENRLHNEKLKPSILTWDVQFKDKLIKAFSKND